jgi:hypothetical protein
MIKNALMAFGVSAGAISALFFGALTACLLFLGSGAAVARNAQGIVATPLVLDARVAAPQGDEYDDSIDVVQAEVGAGRILPLLIDDFGALVLYSPRGLRGDIAAHPAMDGSDPSAGFYP